MAGCGSRCAHWARAAIVLPRPSRVLIPCCAAGGIAFLAPILTLPALPAWAAQVWVVQAYANKGTLMGAIERGDLKDRSGAPNYAAILRTGGRSGQRDGRQRGALPGQEAKRLLPSSEGSIPLHWTHALASAWAQMSNRGAHRILCAASPLLRCSPGDCGGAAVPAPPPRPARRPHLQQHVSAAQRSTAHMRT